VTRWPSIVLLLALAGCRGSAPHQQPAEPEAPVAARQPGRADSIYFVLVDRFANGDPSNDGVVDRSDPQAWHGGDLAGVTHNSGYIADMGFSRVWLSPIFATRDDKWKTYGAFHAYWTYDLRKLHYRFGDRADLERLGRTLEEDGMSFMLDVVLNHVGYDAPLLAQHPEWFHRKGPIVDWNDQTQLETHDVHTLPDLDQDVPAVFEYLVDGSLGWLDLPGLSGFRLDAVKHIGSSFWTRYSQRIHARRKDIDLLGEVYTGTPEQLAHHLASGFDLVFDFPLHFAMVDVFCKGESPQALAAVLSADTVYPDPGRLVTFADNHDLPRVKSSCGGDDGKVRDLLAFQLTARGIPAMTYGTEIGLEGAGEPDNRGDMRLANAEQHPTRELVKRLLWKRGGIEALRAGRDLPVVSDQQTFAYARVGHQQAVVVVVHKGPASRPLALPRELEGGTVTQELTRGRSASAVTAEPGTRAYLVEGDFSRLGTARQISVRLRVHGAPPGSLRLVGSHPKVGLWDPQRGARLEQNGGQIALPRGATVAYKLVSLKPDGTARWENGGNRFLFADRDTDLEVTWRD